MSDKKIAIITMIAATLLSSAAAAVTKKGLGEIPPFSFVFLRLFVATICILPFFLYLKGHKTSKMKELVPISLFATGNLIFFVLGLTFTTANIGSVIYAAVPLIAGFIIYLFFKEKLPVDKQTGTLIGFAGVLLITFLPLLEKGNAFSGNLFGNALLVIGIISWSSYLVFSKKLQEKYSPFIITCYCIFVSSVVLFPFFLWELQSNFGWWLHIGGWGIFSVLYLAIFISIFSYLLNQYTVKHGGAVFAGTMFYLMPIFGFGINFWLLGEQLTPIFIFGSILALLGTYLVVRK